MADAKLSALTALAVPPALNDLAYLVDVSDTTDDAAGSSRKITTAMLLSAPTSIIGQSLPNSQSMRWVGQSSGSGKIDVYTVPSSKRLLLGMHNVYNTTGSTIAWGPFIKVSGNYYRLAASLNALTNALSASSSSVPMILEAGEIFAIDAAATGLNYYLRGVLFDNTSLLKTAKLLSFASGANTLYTCPSGYSAHVGHPGTTQVPLFWPLINGVIGQVLNESGSTRSFTPYRVPSGGSGGSTNQWGAAPSVATAAAANLGSGGMMLLPGDFFQLDCSAAIAAGNGTMAWTTVLEYPDQ